MLHVQIYLEDLSCVYVVLNYKHKSKFQCNFSLYISVFLSASICMVELSRRLFILIDVARKTNLRKQMFRITSYMVLLLLNFIRNLEYRIFSQINPKHEWVTNIIAGTSHWDDWVLTGEQFLPSVWPVQRFLVLPSRLTSILPR